MLEPIKKIYDLSIVSYRFIMNNRRATLTTLIGLVISLTIIISSSMLIESYRPKLVEEILFPERNNYTGEIQLDLRPDALGVEGETGWIQNISFYELKTRAIFKELNYQKYLTKQHWYQRFNIGYWNDSADFGDLGFMRNYNFIDLVCLDSFDAIEPFLDQGGRIPQNYTEILVVTKPDGIQSTIGQQYEVGIPPGQAGPGRSGSINVSVVGVIEYEEIQSFLQENFQTETLSKDFIMLTFPDYGLNLVDVLKKQFDYSFVSHVIGKLFLDPFQIDIYDLPSEKTKFSVLLTDLKNQFKTRNNLVDYIDIYHLQSAMELANSRIEVLKILLFLIDLPVIAISFYLVNYSFNLIKRRKIETIGTIKTRGASNLQIFVFLIVEVIISTIIALLSGLILGSTLVEILLRSINFLDFSGEQIPVLISPLLIQNLIVVSFIVILTLNLASILRYSKMTVFESNQPVENKNPFWKRYYLDVVSTVVGLVGYYIINEVGNITTGFEDSPLIPLVFLLLGVPAPFLLFLGSILIIARMFPILIDRIAKFLWLRSGMILAFALVNIVRHKQTATRTVILMTLALSYVIISASLAFSIDESKRLETNYNIGADMRLDGTGILDESTMNLLRNNITGIRSVSLIVFGYIPSAHNIHYYRFCFVDTETFAETAYFDEKLYGISDSLESLMEIISDNKSILLYKPNFNGKPKVNINDNFTFSLPNKTLEVLINYTIVGSFDLWPQFYKYPWAPEDAYFVIGSLGMFYDLIEPELISISNINYIIDLDENYDLALVREGIIHYSGFTLKSAELLYREYEVGIERRFGLSILNSTLLSCVIVSIVGAFMFTLFTYLERSNERGVERALGMTRFQTGVLFTIEGLTILLFGTTIGLATGLINTNFFVFVTQLGRSIPPIIVAYPYGFISSFILFTLIIASISTLLIAYQSTRRDISRVLKVE
ncbi:MAG: FtsX-like permease family protein [Candidatus Hodarchaeales archaeon]